MTKEFMESLQKRRLEKRKMFKKMIKFNYTFSNHPVVIYSNPCHFSLPRSRSIGRKGTSQERIAIGPGRNNHPLHSLYLGAI